MTINGGGKSPLLQLLPKLIFCLLGLVGKGTFAPSQYGRSFASLGITINGGGHSPPPTPPKDDFMNLGKSWKGGEALFPI